MTQVRRVFKKLDNFKILIDFFVSLSIGAGFASNEMFLFGEMDMKIKLVPGHSAGIVVAYYVSAWFLLNFFLLYINSFNMKHYWWIVYIYSWRQTNRTATKSTSSSLAMWKGTQLFFKQISLLMGLMIGKKGLSCGLIQLKTSIHIQFCGTFTKLCKKITLFSTS